MNIKPNKNAKKTLDITITDETICIQRDFRDQYPMPLNKPMLALLDAIEGNKEAYDIFIHDIREKKRYSSLSGKIQDGNYLV